MFAEQQNGKFNIIVADGLTPSVRRQVITNSSSDYAVYRGPRFGAFAYLCSKGDTTAPASYMGDIVCGDYHVGIFKAIWRDIT